MTTRHAVLVISGCAIALIALSAAVGKTPRIFWNASASVPRGLYIVTRTAEPRPGDLVSAWLPPKARSLAAQRRYLPATIPVIKPVIATTGDTVCATSTAVAVDGVEIATRRAKDNLGRPLPSWMGCKALRDGEVFLLSTHAADSFDGRYFGITPRSDIISVLKPLWTY